MEKEFVFILGNARELAAYELKSVFGEDQTATFNVSENLAIINSEMSEDQIKSLIDVLGGTIKIGVLVGYQDHLRGAKAHLGGVYDAILNDLRSHPARDIGFSFYRGRIDRDRLFEIKNELKNEGIKTRLVLPKKDNILNAAEIRANKLIGKGREYLICGDKVFRTIAVQDIEEITQRDFGKPKANAFSGMLPPKLARMMVNLAVSQVESTKHESRSTKQIQNSKDNKFQTVSDFDIRISDLPSLTVVDPFCGSGNVLIEALDLGYQIQGSDISDKAVEWTKTNLDWFWDIKYKKSNIKNNVISTPESQRGVNSVEKSINRSLGFARNDNHYAVVKADATRDDFLKGVEGPFVVVTEPFLGKPKKGKIDPREADREFEQLSKLYLGFLDNLAKIIKCHPELAEGSISDAGSRCSVIASDPPAGGERGNPSTQKIAEPVPRNRGILTPRNDNIGVSVCLVFPVFELKNGAEVRLYDRVVDKIGSLGYIKLAGPFIYGRDYSIVKREIVLLSTKHETRSTKQ